MQIAGGNGGTVSCVGGEGLEGVRGGDALVTAGTAETANGGTVHVTSGGSSSSYDSKGQSATWA